MSHLGIFISSLAALMLTSCVSVNVGSGKVEKSKNVEYQNPTSPFSSVRMDGADEAWQSNKTGNTISFISECGPAADVSLQSIQTDSLSGLTEKEIHSAQNIDFNGRAALRTLAQGQTDGVVVEVDMLVFKKNGCTYTLSYLGVKKTFPSEQKYFDQFLKSFKAQ